MGHLDFVTIVSFVASGFMILGGVIPYVPQYLETRRTGNSDGFSLYVCLTLLIANTLRILFWFGHPFETPLLIQSIVMIFAMFAMIHICVLVRKKSTIVPTQTKRLLDSSESVVELEQVLPEKIIVERQKVEHQKFTDCDSRYFWNWTHFSSYVQFMLFFSSIAGLITYVFLNVDMYIEVLGFLALICEALLGVPQFHRNWKNQSTRGMSISMVLMWTCGDLFKTMYFILKNTPVQFWVCGMIQVTLDFCILTQVMYYGHGHSVKPS